MTLGSYDIGFDLVDRGIASIVEDAHDAFCEKVELHRLLACDAPTSTAHEADLWNRPDGWPENDNLFAPLFQAAE